jgi:hypothetical protein
MEDANVRMSSKFNKLVGDFSNKTDELESIIQVRVLCS